MFARYYTVFVLLSAVLISAFSSPASARELAVMQDKSASVTQPASFKCGPKVTLTVKAKHASFFDTRLQELGGLFNAGLRNAFASCPQLQEARMEGKVGSVLVLKATATGRDAWSLRLELSELQKRAEALPQRVKDYADISSIARARKPFDKVAGIKETGWQRYFDQQAQASLNQLVTRGIAVFDTHVMELLTGKSDADQAMKPVFEAFTLYRPDLMPVLSDRYALLRSNVAEAKWATLLEETLTPETTLTKAAKVIRAHDGPPNADRDARILEWLAERVDRHEEAHPDHALADLAAHREFGKRLEAANFGKEWPETEAFRSEAMNWYEDVVEVFLEDAMSDAVALIQDAGQTPEELDVIFETGAALAESFSNAGFETQAETVMQQTADHVDAVLAEGLEAFRAELATAPATRDTLTRLQDAEDLYSSLAEDFPQFSDYADRAEQARNALSRQVCEAEAKTASRRASDALLLAKGNGVGIVNVACSLLGNGHRLVALEVNRAASAASLQIETDKGDLVGQDLVALDLDGQTAFADTLSGNSADWDQMLSTLLIPPPNGLPDRDGFTECDYLAGDPFDRSLKQGVDLTNVPPDYDFERAIDACIAAVEQAPDAPRPLFQLARALEAVGETETAQDYFETTAAADYAPAQHALAMHTLTFGDGDDAFFDAIDLLKAASKSGYQPAKTELAALVPPGTEIWREIPGPTDAEVMNTIQKRVCEGIGGFGACAIRTGVHRKSCMQVSEKGFSCELVLRMRCEVRMGNDPLMRMLSGFTERSCPRRTDPMFMKFTKTGNGWSARKESF